jgi:hypothetical protein
VENEMAVPSEVEIREFYERYFRTWNEHDKEGFIDNWKSFATNLAMEDPVGAPVRSGWDGVVDAWDLMNDTITMTLEHLIVCGREAAFVVRNDGIIDGEAFSGISIETMRIEDDGSVLLRNWWEPQGEMLEGWAAGSDS